MPLPKFVRSNRLWVAPMGAKRAAPLKNPSSVRKALRKASVPNPGSRALLSLRTTVLPTAKEMTLDRARKIFGQGVKIVGSGEITAMDKKISPSAFRKTPSDSAELKQMLLSSARHFSAQREAKSKVASLTTQIDALAKLKLKFATVATVSDQRKLARMSLPKIDAKLIEKLSREDPRLRQMSKLLSPEMLIADSEFDQNMLFQKAEGLGKVLTKGKGFVVVDIKGTKKIIYADFSRIKTEARRRAYAVSEVLRKLRFEQDNEKSILTEKSKSNALVLENAKPLINAYKKGEADKGRYFGVYLDYAKAEEEKSLAQEKAIIAQRTKELRSARSTLEFMIKPYSEMYSAKTFEEAILALERNSAISETVSNEYARLLNTMPELAAVKETEAIQLLMPENEEDIRRTLTAHGFNLKKTIGNAALINERGKVYIMPTTIPVLRAILNARMNAMKNASKLLGEMAAKL